MPQATKSTPHKAGPKFDLETYAKVKKMHDEGATLTDIARSIGKCTLETPHDCVGPACKGWSPKRQAVHARVERIRKGRVPEIQEAEAEESDSE